VSPASLCIGLGEPSFIASLAAGIVLALLLGVVLGRLERTVDGSPMSQARRNLVWFAALVAVVFGELVLLDRLFALQHPGEALCTSLVWPWFFVPPIVLFVTGALWGARERNRQASGPSQGRIP
jgi:hypothetical protein